MKILLLALTSLVALTAMGQARPEIGEPCPEFVVRNVMDNPDSTLTSADLKGKFVILDFWSKYCSACMGTLPKTDSIYSEYKDRIAFLLIGHEDMEERMRPMFYKFKSKLKLTIPFAFDSALFWRFVPHVVPHLIWIDDQGIVKAITTSKELIPENVDAFLRGQTFNFRDWSFAAVEQRENQWDYDYTIPFMIDGNGGNTNHFICRSLLVPFEPGKMTMVSLPFSVDRFVKHYPKGCALQGCATLEELYKFAYTGYPTWFFTDSPYQTFFPKCEFTVQDSTPFDVDFNSFRGLYWYSLLLSDSRSTKENLLTSLQQDLKKSFGYDVRVIDRKQPCWIVTANRKARKQLRTKGQLANDDHIEPAEIKLTNVPIGHVIASIFYKHTQDRPPILDKTGIKENVDILVGTNIYDFEEIRASLATQGLIVRKSRTKMKTIVISD